MLHWRKMKDHVIEFLARLLADVIRLLACVPPVDRLNITVEVINMLPAIRVGETRTVTIAPTANGVPDANVTGVTFEVLPPGAYTIASVGPLTAQYTAAIGGTAAPVCVVHATNETGDVITEQADLPDITAGLVADKLNITVSAP